MACIPRSDEIDNDLTVTQHTVNFDLEKGIIKDSIINNQSLMDKIHTYNNKELESNQLEKIDTGI